MGELIEINQKRVFTLEDAEALLPIVNRITRTYKTEANKLNTQISLCPSSTRRRALEQTLKEVFQQWTSKMMRLGCDAKGMWLVDFDNGEGYYCWHFPEDHISYYHGYHDGFQGRLRIV